MEVFCYTKVVTQTGNGAPILPPPNASSVRSVRLCNEDKKGKEMRRFEFRRWKSCQDATRHLESGGSCNEKKRKVGSGELDARWKRTGEQLTLLPLLTRGARPHLGTEWFSKFIILTDAQESLLSCFEAILSCRSKIGLPVYSWGLPVSVLPLRESFGPPPSRILFGCYLRFNW